MNTNYYLSNKVFRELKQNNRNIHTRRNNELCITLMRVCTPRSTRVYNLTNVPSEMLKPVQTSTYCTYRHFKNNL